MTTMTIMILAMKNISISTCKLDAFAPVGRSLTLDGGSGSSSKSS